jgi:predicted AAA+ superfamily ATPase
MECDMELFVNREHELQLIEDSFRTLVGRKHLLRTPIIDIYGVRGIGKTSLLKQVEQRCHATQLPYIWVDVGRSTTHIAHEVIKQVQRYTQEKEIVAEESAVYATRALLQQGPVVMLFDSVDTTDAEQLARLESLLRDLVDDEKLFVVLASKNVLAFQQERSVARKLTTLPLKPLDRENCEFYLSNLENQIEPEVRDIIYAWTRGYPLAMNIMAQAISDGLDPRTEQGQRDMLSLLTERVIYQEVLATTEPEKRRRYFTALQLFSVPRRFNLMIMQDLIETFAPELGRESSLAYFGLHREINEATDILNWNMLRVGFCVDAPIRNIFLLSLKIEQPQRYFSVHDFLAKTNLRLAREIAGSDRVRYIRECLYHTASDTDSPLLPELLDQAMQIIIQQPPETFLQFSEEFAQDEELKESLGSHLSVIQAMIDGRLAEIKAAEG